MDTITLLKPSKKLFDKEVFSYKFQGENHTVTFWSGNPELVEKCLFEHFQKIGLITYVEKTQVKEDGKMVDVTDIGYMDGEHEMETEFDTHKDNELAYLMRVFLTECHIITSYKAFADDNCHGVSSRNIIETLSECKENKSDEAVEALFDFASKLAKIPVDVIKERMAFE